MSNVVEESGVEARVWNGGCAGEGGGSAIEGGWFEANERMEF